MRIADKPTVDSGVEDGIKWITLVSPIPPAMNGYVQLPPDHPWRVADLAEQFAKIHGGITYGPDGDGWIGFDTLHSGDRWPGGLFEKFPRAQWHNDWTPALVAEEARDLARQVAEALAEDEAMR
jgi:hypothetical protein